MRSGIGLALRLFRAVSARMTRAGSIGFLLAVATVVAVMWNQRDVGLARDETVYLGAAPRYAEFWMHPWRGGRAGIDATFGGPMGGGNNPEHPPLVKELSGFSYKLAHGVLGVDEISAFRFPSAVMHGACVWLVFDMTLAIWGLAEAIIAALCLLLLPRALFHAGLACFDAPIMAMWFATIYAYWKCLDDRRWPWQVGVAFGLALATKHTAVLLPFALGAHYLVLAIRARRVLHPRVIISVAVLGPAVLFALWPWLWLDPIGHVREWLAFHMHHVHYNFEYLGENWNAPPFPWHVALVTTLFTVPTATLAAAGFGAYAWIRRGIADTRRPGLLLALSAAASMGPFFLGSTPIFGAEKHWMPALPSLCIVAGIGAVWAARRAATAIPKLRERVAIAIVGGAVALAGLSETVTAQPYALTWYSALAGGAPGGADRGMNRQFWGVAARGVVPFINSQPPGPVYSHDASPAWGWYERTGLLAKGHPDSGHEDAGVAASKYAIVIHEKHFNRHDYMIWKAYGTLAPVYVLRADGVPIVSVYRRP
jgi:4-amino-4-deoxy-L-arabinose transferase-like glycosyltransferase